jgi:hypothetical protein
MPAKRTVPSSYTMLRAEFGFIGNRSQVLECATRMAQEGVANVDY